MFGRDERAQAVQVGAILLFAVLIIALSLYQAFVVPQENKEIEFADYQDASGDLTDLHRAMLSAAGNSPVSSVTVRTGSQYPARVFAANPPPATGRLSATSASNVTLTNVRAVNGEAQNTRAYWAGTEKNFSTRAVVFTPEYNALTGVAPVVVSGTSTYRAFEASVVPEAGQTLISENRITLVTVDGDLSAGGLTTAVAVEPVSAATRTVTVSGDGGADINVSLPLSASTNASAWNESALADSMRANTRVKSVTVAGPSRVNVTLDGTRQYELRLARVEVRGVQDSNTVSALGPTYVVPAQGDNVSVPAGQSLRVVAEVRDRYNNPVSGVGVTFEDGGTGSFTPTPPITTAGTGQAGTNYVRSSDGTAVLNASFGGTDSLNRTDITVQVLSSTGGGGGSPPTVTVDSATHKQKGQDYDIDVEFSASDPDGDLAAWSVTLYDSQGGALLDTKSGTSFDSPTKGTFKKESGGSAPFYVVVEVEDQATNTATDDAQTTAG